MMTRSVVGFIFLFLLSIATSVQGRLGDFLEDFQNHHHNPFHHHNQTFCERLGPHELPKECICKNLGSLSSSSFLNFGFEVACVKPFHNMFFNDTIGLKLVVDPCNEKGSQISIDITEETHQIDYPISGIRAGEVQLYPIPGLSIIVPTIGSLGVDVAVSISGNPDQLTLMVGLNACTQLHTHTVCASSVPGLNRILPWWVLSGTYAFGDMCNSTSTTTSTEFNTATFKALKE